MDQSTIDNNKTFFEQDLMLKDKFGILNNIDATQYGNSKEDWDRIEDVPSHVNRINIFLVIGIAISFILLAIGLSVLIKNGSIYGLYVTLFGILILGVFIYGIFALRWFQTKSMEFLEKEAFKQPEELDNSNEYAFLNIFYMLLMFFFICCLFVTIVCFGFQSYYLNPIRTAGMNQDTWRKFYGEQNYNDVYDNGVCLLYIGAISALVLGLFTMGILIICFRMIGPFRSWQTINEFVCIAIFIIGFVMIYYGVYCIRLENLAKIDKAMPECFPEVLIFAGIASICISILGFVGSYYENKKVIHVFAILSVISSVLLLTTFIASILISNSFTENYECKDLLDNIGQNYAIEMLDCDKKYLFIQDSIDNMQCPKDRIVNAWEVDLGLNSDQQSEYYGCLDIGCCSKTFHAAKKNLNFISVTSFLIFILTVLISIGAFYMNDQLPHKTQFGISNKNIKIVLIVVASTIAIIILTFMTLIPEVKPSPFLSKPVEKSNLQGVPESSVLQVDIQKLNRRSAFLKNVMHNNTIITENKAPCGENCLDVEYYYELSSNDGVFTANETLLQNANISIRVNEAKDNGWIVGFAGDDNNLEDFTKYFNFVNNCPLHPASIRVKVSAKAVENTTKDNSSAPSFLEKKAKPTLNLIQIRNKQNEVVEVSVNATVVNVANMTLGETVDVLDKSVDYSFVSNKKQKVTGKVMERPDLFTIVPADKASIKVTADEFPNCPVKTYITNVDGTFTTDGFYVPQKDAPIKYTFDFSFNTYPNMKQSVFIGGIGQRKINNIGQVVFMSERITDETYDFKTKLFDSVTNKPLQGVNATLYTGLLILANSEYTKGNPNYSNYTTNENKLISSSTTNEQGYFTFEKLPANKYTIVLEKEGYYREVKSKINFKPYLDIDIIGSLTKPIVHSKLTPRVQEGEIRFVLDWPNGPIDLDLYSYFKVSKMLKCSVFFGNKDCPGVTFDAEHLEQDEFGGEVITINTLGKYVYTFAVNKYINVFNSTAAGDNPVEGAEIPQSKSPDITLPDTNLSDSDAKISVYSDKFVGPITQISVPSTEDNADKMNWWLSLCLDGSKGIQSLSVINKLFMERPHFNYCESFYKISSNF